MMPTKSTAALTVVLLFILPSFEAQRASNQLREVRNGAPSANQEVTLDEIHENNERDTNGIEEDTRNTRDCDEVVCENGGTAKIRRGRNVCFCPHGYIGNNCQFRGKCDLHHRTDCFLKETHPELTNVGYWHYGFQHHFLAARAKYSKTIHVMSKELYLGKPHKLTFSYQEKKRNKHHQPRADNELTVAWKKGDKAGELYKQIFGKIEGAKGVACVNIPRGYGQLVISFRCWNPYHCNIVPHGDRHYIFLKNTQLYLDWVNLEPGHC